MNRKKLKGDTAQQSGEQQSHTKQEVLQSCKGKTIGEINRMAREQGITYGKLVAKMYAGQVRIGR